MIEWERDHVYPTWEQLPQIVRYLGFAPFTDPALGSRKSNETQAVVTVGSR